MTQVLGIPREEAAELLRKGDTGFIRQAELFSNPGSSNAGSTDPNSSGFSRTLSELKRLEAIHPGAPFYAGLLVGEYEVSNGNNDSRLETLLFGIALESPSLPTRREAAIKLLRMILEKNSSNDAIYILGILDSGSLKSEFLPLLRAACLYRLGRYGEAAGLIPVEPTTAAPIEEWEKTIALFSAWKAPAEETLRTEFQRAEVQREIPFFLFGIASSEVREWASNEALSSAGLLGDTERAALLGRRSGGNYGASLNHLRTALADGGLVFFRYPALIADLGRAFQYTPSMRGEGAELFRSWAESSETGNLPETKYPILFYAGRIERARGNYEASSDYFLRAFEYAPDTNQSDACIWYMLMNALAESPAAAASLVKTTISQWGDLSYFDDVLDRLSNYYTGRRQWNDLLEIFFSLENRGPSASLAQYAWILGRAAEEGYLSSFFKPERFFRTAFETKNASFYYRAMAAAKLGLTLVPENENPEAEKATARDASRPETDFLLGFFECGAASFALPYIQAVERQLPVPELREIAAALAASGRHKESLDFVSRYIDREPPPVSCEDLLLFYPQPFKEMVERYAAEAELMPELLYALIRTESYFVPEIVSRSGAVGLVQLMPATAEEMAERIVRRGGPDYRVEGLDLKDPEINVHIGSYYLSYLNTQMGSPMLALLAYNGGMGRVRRWLTADRRQGGLPEDLFLETIEFTETREYGRRVAAAAAIYGYLYYGKGMEEIAAGIMGVRE